MTRAIFLLAALLSAGLAFARDTIGGVPRILDGDTVDLHGTHVRLSGIDAPETDQVCLDAKGSTWTCGISALNALISYSAGRSWSCSLQATPDRYGRRIGTCSVGKMDVQAWMATSWALAYRKYSAAYIGNETQAKRGASRLVDWRVSRPVGLAPSYLQD